MWISSRYRGLPLAAAVLALSAMASSVAPGRTRERRPVDFASEVRPLLSDRCLPCHGPDPASLEANLRLDLRASATADRGGYAAIVPGDAQASELVYRITDEFDRMPPPASKLQLDPTEIELLTRWVDEGAPYAVHWSFERPARRPPPEVRNESWVRDPIDRFVLAKLEEHGLAPAPQAERATLLRRVSYDLRGLPPTLEELDAYLADETPDAYERVVDRYLASAAHAERLTADWLDRARYADTFGYQSDVEMHVWPWRDWVLDAFQSNLPCDDFLTQQLAGDLLPGATRETRLATAFNRLHRQTNEGGSIEEEFRLAYVSDRVETMSAAFLGLTVACARCHDHKFDPIPQRDYYALSSFFDDIDESGLYSHFTTSVPTPALDLATPDQERRLAALEADLAAVEERVARLRKLPGRGREARAYFAFEPPDVGQNSVPGGAPAELVDAPVTVEGALGSGLLFSGEDAVVFPGVGDFHRSDPFSIGLRVQLPVYERAVVLHRSKSWTDAGSRGYQLLVEDGRLSFALVHFWPGDAIAIRTREPVATGRWLHVTLSYDGSSCARGLRIYLDGLPAETEIVRDHLTRTIRGGGIEHLTVGSRFRDRGYKAGRMDELAVYDRELCEEEVLGLHTTGRATTGAPDPEANALGYALRALRRERDDLRDEVRQIMTMAASRASDVVRRETHVLARGDYSAPREAVAPATLSALPDLGSTDARDRLDLARWLTHPDHPLTARVQVDRLWRVAFSRGLIPTPEDLGSQGPVPVHRALLDTLARDLIDSGWDGRSLLRRLVLSATYRQSSRPEPDSPGPPGPPGPAGPLAGPGLDPTRDLLSGALRGPLPAEMVRDGALRAAGLLVERRGGPPVFPFQPPGLWFEKSQKRYPTGRGDDLRRRSLYTFWKRTSPPPTLSMFDAPAREVCSVARPATTTPLQALALWNDPQFVEVAVVLASRALASTEDDTQLVAYLMRALTSRPPTAVEERALLGLLTQQRAAFRADPSAAQALAAFDLEQRAHPSEETASDTARPATLAAADAVERASVAVLASTLLSLDSTISRR